jgi:uncharacterized membrane protein YfcA
MFWIALVLALFVGGSLGLLGGGGSILTLPILRYALGMPAHEAIAVSLFVVGATSVAALIPHARRKHVEWTTGAAFGAAGMVGAYLAGRFSKYLPPALLLLGFGLMMLATGFAMLRRRSSSKSKAPSDEGRTLQLAKIVGEGLVVGAVTGMVGAGGGFLVVPALVLLGKLPMQTAVGTSLLVIAMKSFAGFAGFWGHTSITWSIALPLAAVAVVGSLVGGALAARVSARALQASFGWFVIAMAFFMLAQELPPIIGIPGSTSRALLVTLVGTGLTALAVVSRRYMRPRKPQEPKGPSIGTNPVTLELGGKSP